MANTIQLKRGTGSSEPSSLAVGELAINIDSGKLFYGSGSSVLSDFKFDKITAETYVVSSSVTFMTTSYSSGSTEFGDSALDTHTFTGHITASGDITSSGDVYASDYFDDGTNISSIYSPIAGGSGIVTVGTIATGEWNATAIPSAKLDADTAHLTTTQTFSGAKTFTLPVTASSHLQVTGNVSSSGVIFASNYYDDGTPISSIYSPIAGHANIVTVGTIGTGEWNATVIPSAKLDGDTAHLTTAQTFSGVKTFTLPITASSHIQADGNVSSSGAISASNYYDDGANISTIYSPIAGHANIVTVGTIGTGEWNATAIPSAKLDADTAHLTTAQTFSGVKTFTLPITASSHIKAVGAIEAAGTISSSDIVHGTQFKSHNKIVGLYHAASGTMRLGNSGTSTDIFGTTVSSSAALSAQAGVTEFISGSSDIAQASGDVVYFGGGSSFTSGSIYHFKSNGDWETANANAVATSDGLLAVALGAGPGNGMLLRGMVTLDHDPGAVGDVLYLSNTAGDASATAPSDSDDVVRVIGYCLHASSGNIWFNPDSTYVEIA